MKRIFLWSTLAIVISFISCSKDGEGNDNFTEVITVTQKGTLKSLLQKYGLIDATQLTIAGTLGEADFETLKGLRSLESLDLSGVNISTLPAYALYDSYLKSIILPENLEEIGLAALSKNSITMITIPSSVHTIGELAFAHCEDLETVSLSPNSQLKTIMGNRSASYNTGGAFYCCKSLTSINIPASVEIIGYWAFDHCHALRTVTFQPNSRLKIMDGAFWVCESLTSIEIPAGIEILESTFVGCTSLKNVRFQANSQLRTIGAATFQSCPLETIDASNCSYITSIGAPNGNMDLKTVNLFILGTKTPPLCNFLWLNNNAALRVPQGCVNAYKNANGWKNFAYISE